MGRDSRNMLHQAEQPMRNGFKMSIQRAAALRGGIILLLAVLAGCSGGQKDRTPPVPKVGFVVVQPSAVPIAVSLGGRTVAYETSEVRPQVDGIIRQRLFTEGSYVRAGQPLYQIDASLYRAAVNAGCGQSRQRQGHRRSGHRPRRSL